ncbi:MAG TPA: DNA adenine methylase [Polyangiaceae bacterium]|nr:DNA adenine methylase [Polyangiaceae bacterium]
MRAWPPGRPVLKWAGGKTQLLEPILRKLPGKIDTYYEPFVGGGAVFFALAAEGRFERAVLADRNPDLVEVYRALAENVEKVIEALLAYRYDEVEYYRIRDQRPRSKIQRAARLIYLNKTGYNGLYRVNRKGQFNVPFGRYKNPRICDPDNLRAAARALQQAEIHVADFEEICARARTGDAVYLDPPYVPVSKTANFTAYDRHAFDLKEHERLARVFAGLAKRRVASVLSNSNTEFTRDLYRRWQCAEVGVNRSINCEAGGRKGATELLVVNKPLRKAAAASK